MMKTAAYIRVSTEEQTEGFSLDAQKNTLLHFAEEKGFIISSFYIEEGRSASTIHKRPELKRLLLDAEQRKFQQVLIVKVDRLSRKSKDASWILQYFEKLDIKLVSVRENMDLTSTTGKAMYQIVSSFAEFERNKLIDNVTTGMKQRAMEGKFLGGQLLGYDTKDKQLVIHPLESRIVKTIFLLYASGWTKKEIADFLNHCGFKTKKGNDFSIPSLTKVLTNQIYISEFSFQFADKAISADGIHESIVDQRLFLFAQSRFDKQLKLGKSNWLTHTLSCPDCHQPMVASQTLNRGVRHLYYSCSTKKTKGECSLNSIPKSQAEKQVLAEMETLLQALQQHPSFQLIHQSTVRLFSKEWASTIELLKEQLESIQNKKKHLDQLMERGLKYEIVASKYKGFDTQIQYIAAFLNSLSKTEKTEEPFLTLHTNSLNYLSRCLFTEARVRKETPSKRSVVTIATPEEKWTTAFMREVSFCLNSKSNSLPLH